MTVIDDFADVVGIETSYNVCLTYANNRDSKYGIISERGKPLSIEYPVKSADDHQNLRQIEDQLAAYNRSRNDYESCYHSEFDAAILEMLPIALDAEGLQPTDFDIPVRYLRALIIKKARNLKSNQAIANYLLSNKDLADDIGFESIPENQSTFWYHYDSVDDNPVATVVTRLVHATYRNGVAVPDETKQKYDLENYNTIDETKLSQEVKNEALQNWMDEILDDIIEPVKFGRAQNTSYSEREIIGAMALGSLINGPHSAPIVGSRIFDNANIISADHLYTLIKSLDKYEIDDTLKEVNNRIIQYASEIGFFGRPQHIALDTTWVSWSGQGGNDELRLINNPERCDSGRGWCFATLALMFSENRFVLDIDLVQDKSDTIDIFRGQLRDAHQAGINIGRIHADREFYAGDTVNMCRSIAGNNYAIRVKLRSNGEPPKIIESMPLSPGEAKIVEDVDFANIQPRVNVCGHKLPDDSNKSTNKIGFLTDMTADDIQPSSLYHSYNYRWSVETIFKQLKHGLAPKTKSSDPIVRLFFFKMGSVFYNIHTLINRARSPKYGYRLNVPYYQVLLAIATSIFTS